MRILYVTGGFPYPLTSGYLRHYFLIKELSRRHRITLLSVVGANFTAEHGAALGPFTERVLTFSSTAKSRSFRRKAIRRVRLLASCEPSVRQLRLAIHQLTRNGQFHAALLSGKQTFPVIQQLNGLPVVVDMCDATSMKIRGNMRYASPGRLALLLLDYMKVRRAERTLMRHARHLLFASCRDREVLLGPSDNHATVVPNGVNLDFWSRSTHRLGAGTIVFTGAMDYPPNTDAALQLIEEILPLVQRSVPSAQLLIAGRDPTAQLIRAGRRQGVAVTGFLDDLRPYLEQATVFAAPLRFAAGIQNKVLEAMAMGVPVVASPLAADGLRTEDGECPPLGIASTAGQFAELITQQLLNQPNNPAPDAKARRFVERHFVWRRSGQTLDQVICSVVDKTRGENVHRSDYRSRRSGQNHNLPEA